MGVVGFWVGFGGCSRGVNARKPKDSVWEDWGSEQGRLRESPSPLKNLIIGSVM